ncbi:DUF4180 domain-containing protein [Sphingobacterium hungaricum]|uniref:DUF4180 domain-containing protein n=1 Tax=Sphingobacterium hungaricum TaxID=2082723 RepID=A0A928YRV9_9SPHI|nr:DUF4180 domain-containing protein [Sphingobacterium hungaricum]MBE8715092.1 DUF4180 domain-containing protein [Sphingobacterium hungaricum]
MQLIEHAFGDKKVAELTANETLINDLQDAIDLMADLYYQGFDHIILKKEQLNPDFFELKTKLAGDILQKFSNYRMQLSIIIPELKTESNALNDFIRESNRLGHINFVQSIEEISQKS